MLDFVTVIPVRYAEPVGKLVKLRWIFGIIGLELYISASGGRPKVCGSNVYEVK
jgi:hypothetical protein